ncbi:uridine diphosphate glucose pyrophosphatase NUDT22-like [Penaeus japonicus]|uniref:uridine diphosphate glucose pyrophosphatase NUDT22-like n=1 Tax=Penaeus japonicus TaxID=27405 RepID=UPI001C70BE53|nr:uridine diphosphate glucose pyrophosphatase NUDT22-like [Penaeus japonicus]
MCLWVHRGTRLPPPLPASHKSIYVAPAVSTSTLFLPFSLYITPHGMIPGYLRSPRAILQRVLSAKVRKMSTRIDNVELVHVQNVSIAKTSPALPGRALSRDQLAANFKNSEFSRKLNPRLEKDIANRWKVKIAQNPRLFNGSKFRRAGWEISDGKLVINVGLTNYKDLCGTNFAENCNSLLDMGEREFGNSQAYMADALGVGVLLLTKDSHLVVARRADWLLEYPNFLDRAGGHPEPDHVFTPDGSLKPGLETDDVHEAVMNEIWDSAIKEAEDEVGLSRNQLEDFSCLGVTANTDEGGRPSMEFFAKLSLTASEVKALHASGNQVEADELTNLCMLPLQQVATLVDLLLEGKPDPVGNDVTARDEPRTMLKEMTSALKGALLLAHHHQMLSIDGQGEEDRP